MNNKPIIIMTLYFRKPADNDQKRPKLFLDVAKTSGELSKYPSLQYEKHSQRTMLVELTGALTKKGKELS
jgi:hypothetical protein